jgi:hypothetical protein
MSLSSGACPPGRWLLQAAALFLIAGSGFAQPGGLSLQTGVTLQSREELQQTIGDAGQAEVIVAGAIAALAPSLARSEKDPRELGVIAAQLPAEWLPAVNGVTFRRLEWADAKRAWEDDCLHLLWVGAKVEGSTLTITVAEGNKCNRRGSHYVFLRTDGGWRSAREGGGFATVGDPCACR